MNRLTHLNSLQAVETALRCGSLKSAAAELGITAAAVGQRIRALEDYLGMPLLLRSSSGLTPTPVLRGAMEDLDGGFRLLAAVAEQLKLPYPNRVVISGDEDWIALWLAPRLTAFIARYPELDVVVRPAVAAGPPADLVVSFRAADEQTLLFRDYLLPVISPENRARIGGNPLETRLEGFPLLHVDCYTRDAESLDWCRWVQRFGHRSSDSARGVRYARVEHALQGVASNAGIALCGLGLALDAVKAGELVLPFPVEEGAWTEYGYCLECVGGEPLRRPVRLLREWLLKEAAETGEALSARVRGRPTAEVESVSSR